MTDMCTKHKIPKIPMIYTSFCKKCDEEELAAEAKDKRKDEWDTVTIDLTGEKSGSFNGNSTRTPIGIPYADSSDWDSDVNWDDITKELDLGGFNGDTADMVVKHYNSVDDYLNDQFYNDFWKDF